MQRTAAFVLRWRLTIVALMLIHDAVSAWVAGGR